MRPIFSLLLREVQSLHLSHRHDNFFVWHTQIFLYRINFLELCYIIATLISFKCRGKFQPRILMSVIMNKIQRMCNISLHLMNFQSKYIEQPKSVSFKYFPSNGLDLNLDIIHTRQFNGKSIRSAFSVYDWNF